MTGKNCPCCCGKAKAQERKAKNGYFYGFIIRCIVCGLQTKLYQTEDEAWSAWNKRCENETNI